MRIFFILLLVSINAHSISPYIQFFTDNTMRVDYFHTGTAVQEYFSMDQVYQEGLWPGSKNVLIDSTNMGEYFFRVQDLHTSQIIFSRGYCSIFGEWQTTREAIDGIYRTMHETVRFPFPKNPVQLTISKRDKNSGVFIDSFSTIIDPVSRFINREKKTYPYAKKALMENGDPCEKVDVVILADGYTKAQRGQFRREAQYYTRCLFHQSPFSGRQKDFNVWTIEAVSNDSGIDDPREDKWRHNVIGTSYNIFDVPRYALSLENRQIHDIASLAPYDFIIILFNSSRYGGGGIYNCQATCFTGTDNHNPAWWAEYVFIHEFGHLFAGLGDEYYSSTVAYQDFYPTGIEPWVPNVTRLLDPSCVKWQSLMSEDTPVPTPWEKVKYDSLSKAMSQVKTEQQKAELRQMMKNIITVEQNPLPVGCYEGAGYVSTGLYRPALDCIMFSKSLIGFCPVCRDAIEKMIDRYAK